MAEHDENSATDLIPDRDLFGMAKQLKSVDISTLPTKLGFSNSQWKEFEVFYDRADKHMQGIFLMLLYWKKRNPTSEEVQQLKTDLDRLEINTEGYFQITPEETGERPHKCEECQRYFLNDKGLRGHQGKVQCDQRSVHITVTMPYTNNTTPKVHTLQARKPYTRKHFPSKQSAIGVGLRFGGKRTLGNNGSVSITMPHCAIFSQEHNQAMVDTMKLYRYDSQTSTWNGKKLVSSEDEYPNIKLRERDLDLNIQQLDDWWILSLINDSNIFKGKRLVCTPFVPSRLKNDDRDCMDVCLTDDNGFVEDRRPGFRKGCESQELRVDFGRGSLWLAMIDGQTVIDKKEIVESDFEKFTQHLVTFTLPGNQGALILECSQAGDESEPLRMNVPLQDRHEE